MQSIASNAGCSAESPERDSVSSEPALLLGRSVLVSLVTSGEETSVLLAGSSESARLSVLHLVG